MAMRGLVPFYDSLQTTTTPGEIRVKMMLQGLDENTPNQAGPMWPVEAIFLFSDTPAQIKSKIQTACLAVAAANSYVNLTASDLFLPTYSKG